MPRKRELPKSFRFTEDELKQVNEALKEARLNPRESESEILLSIIKEWKEPDVPEKIVERWLCPFCPDLSVENRERLLSHFASFHLIEETVEKPLSKLRHAFQVAMRTKKIQDCGFLDMSLFPFRCAKNFPDRPLAKIDNVNLCIACQERDLSRDRPETNKGSNLVQSSYMKTLNPDSKLCDCPKLTETTLCSIDNRRCYEKDCQQYYFYKKGQEASN